MDEEEGTTVNCVMLGETAAFVDSFRWWVGFGCMREGVGYQVGRAEFGVMRDICVV